MSAVGRQRRASPVILLAGCALLGGCGLLRSVGLLPSPPPPPLPPVAVTPPPPVDYLLALRLTAAPNINPDSLGRASPLRVHVYVDERDPRLGERGFESVFGTEADGTGGGGTEPFDTLVVVPGRETELALTPAREAAWVTVAAAYREPWSAIWFDTVRVDTGGPTEVSATFGAAEVRVVAEPDS